MGGGKGVYNYDAYPWLFDNQGSCRGMFEVRLCGEPETIAVPGQPDVHETEPEKTCGPLQGCINFDVFGFGTVNDPLLGVQWNAPKMYDFNKPKIDAITNQPYCSEEWDFPGM